MSSPGPSRACLEWPVFGLAQAEKDVRLGAELEALTERHRSSCAPYRRILAARAPDATRPPSPASVPFLPVRLFKDYALRSVPEAEVFKVLSSSGTSSQKVARIFLDRDTAAAQSRALVRILQAFLGKARMPMLIIDHPGVIKDRHAFSARGAGILGMSSFGRDHTYALKDDTMDVDVDAIRGFAERHRGERVFLFGFTFMVWRHFCAALRDDASRPVFADAILIHGGGWKKLQDQAVDNDIFKQTLAGVFGVRSVHNFYGMVEQVGSVFMECEHGRLHAPAFADVLIRDPHDWSVLPAGRRGLIQVLSALPTSYPGHSLLTEDQGEMISVDDCPCGRLGRTFRVHGRLPQAELRGCGDTHAAQFAAAP